MTDTFHRPRPRLHQDLLFAFCPTVTQTAFFGGVTEKEASRKPSGEIRVKTVAVATGKIKISRRV